MDLRDDREQLFGNLARPETSQDFFRRVADDVDWTVEGMYPLAGRFITKKAFNEATFDRIGPLLREGARLEVQHLFLDGATTIAELRATSTTSTMPRTTTPSAGSAASTPPRSGR
jgi:uncharacterized protein